MGFEAKKKKNRAKLWRAIQWGQIGNLIAFIVGLGGESMHAAFFLGAIITLVVSYIGT